MSDSHEHADAGPAARLRRVETLLEAAGVVTGAALDVIIDGFAAVASPANGAAVVARAWTDEAYRARLLADGNAALAELGFAMHGDPACLLRVVENTEAVHNVVVCTLCSCYPVGLLGPSPSWYKSEAYRSRVVREPRVVLAEFGLAVAASVEIRVWDASSELRYLVLPRRPAGTDGWTDDRLAALITRHGLIGTAAV